MSSPSIAPPPKSGVSWKEALSQVRFWVLWYQFAVLVGGGFSFLNNLNAVVTAVG